MSIAVMSYVWKHSTQKGSALLTLLAIADFAHDDGANAYPSIAALAEKTRLTERNVQLVIKTLETSGELRVRRNAGPHGCHLFTIIMGEVKSFQGEKFSGVKSFQGEKSHKRGVKSSALLQPQISPDPLLDPSEEDPEESPPYRSPQGDEGKVAQKSRTKAKRKKTYFPLDLDKQEALKASVVDQRFRDWFAGKALSLDLETQWEAFRGKALAKGYSYFDWRQGFMNWLTSDYQHPVRGRSPSQRPLSEAEFLAAMEEGERPRGQD